MIRPGLLHHRQRWRGAESPDESHPAPETSGPSIRKEARRLFCEPRARQASDGDDGDVEHHVSSSDDGGVMKSGGRSAQPRAMAVVCTVMRVTRKHVV